MGRTLKRVPLDFDWPLKQTWKGYISPYRAVPCVACAGSGYSPEYKRLQDEWYGWDRPRGYAWQYNLSQEDVDALVAERRLHDFTHTFTPGIGWQPKDPHCQPTADEVNDWSRHSLGHDGINCYIVVKAKLARLGLPWACPACHGAGEFWQTPEIEAAAEAWTGVDPPSGDGYQLWETTSEGSPVSPVFAGLDDLCEWAAEHATTFGTSTATAADWKRMLSDDFVYHQEGNAVFM